MTNPFALFALVASAGACLSLLSYSKQGARHRRRVSWLAWVLLAVLGCSAIDLAVHARDVGFLEAMRTALLSLFIICARGNVARLLWSNENAN